ncbi:caspase family protein [Roseobacter sp. EG26]|uniref:caspase family protein n=1 Tax=Roseobacter sp. EG26 TaxID=3412477 RepID=UPI003CE54A24
MHTSIYATNLTKGIFMTHVAVVVGINHYSHTKRLEASVKDAKNVARLLERHGDKTSNFEVIELYGNSPETPVTRAQVRANLRKIFAGENETAIFYFSGHGALTESGGAIICSDSETADDGIKLDEVIALVNASTITNKIIILDCCRSGAAGNAPLLGGVTTLPHGLTILAASTEDQLAYETNAGGVFTNLLCDALEGAAANLKGEITPGSIYAHIDQSLGNIDQRPVFKTSVQRFVSLRRVAAPVPYEDLLDLTELFPDPQQPLQLGPEFEPKRPIAGYDDIPDPDPEKTKKFAALQRLNRVNLVVPQGALHMFDAAMGKKHAALTTLGHHYWRLVKTKRI